MARQQLRKSNHLVALLTQIPESFLDDGCSNSPDSIFGFNLRWACRLHDWRYCGRCHPPGRMTQADRLLADKEIKQYIGQALPWRWRWVKYVYFAVLRRAGGTTAWNSCGPAPWGVTENQHDRDVCRHNIERPEWMDARTPPGAPAP